MSRKVGEVIKEGYLTKSPPVERALAVSLLMSSQVHFNTERQSEQTSFYLDRVTVQIVSVQQQHLYFAAKFKLMNHK